MLLVCGVIAVPLFVVTFLAEGATRAGYDPLRHPVSSLPLGDYGWMQTANFGVAGLLTLALAVGMRRAFRPLKRSIWGPLLVGVWGIGLIGAGIFPRVPVSDYPPGTPDQLRGYGWHGVLRDLAFSLRGTGSGVLRILPPGRGAGRGRLGLLFGTHRPRLHGRVRPRQRRLRAGQKPGGYGRVVTAHRSRRWLRLANLARPPRSEVVSRRVIRVC